ncbi:hypothetical protein MesoLjLc_22080 [Mesorhizobium sp. L-8-10]|uniref:hypothetical protein n=1 Tax=Mesorhizobium sp. L-8-10 TaxID=2744523 RepID=UPI001928E764|nr:hypothetical protein [Mesorhizobium sp. L-8-10]BCH30278.1 hypothetical protein MesoLjLc_22080 [Mesorhizobium sp. L-8-10]
MIPFATYAPDRSPFDPEATDSLENVLPIQGGYGPFPSFRALSQPLPERPQGSYLGYVNNGNYVLVVGTKTKLLMFDGTTLTWTDVSKPGGYSTADSERWSFAQYGSWLIATNSVDPVQYIDLNSPVQFADLSADAPRAKLVGTMGDFVMLSHLNTNQRMVQWSGLNQPQFWSPRQRSSDFQAFPDGGEIMGFAGGVNGCLIFHAESVREGNLALETSMVMTFKQTLTNHGCMAPKSVVATGSGIYYLSDDGFYRYGIPPVGIGVERVDNTFIDDISRQEIYNVYGSEDPNRKIVYWAYRSIANTLENSYDKVLLYHYGVDRWSLLKPNRIMTGLIDATTPGFTLDSLSSLGIPLDQLPYSLDSRAWSGGTPTIAAFDTDWRLGFFSGDPLQAVLQTGDVELTSGSRTIVTGFRPLCDASSVSGRSAAKDRAGSPRNWKNPADVSAKTGLIPARTSGRFHRFEVTVQADQPWSAIHGVDPEGQPEGQQ